MSGFSCSREIREEDLFFPQPAVLTDWGEGVRSETLEAGNCRLSVAVIGDSNSGILLYFYGNGEQIDTSLFRMRWLHRISGLQVICADYRGYGRSTGIPSLAVLQSDARLLVERYAPEGTRPILAYGRSIGTIPAIALCEHGLLDGAILEAPFTTAGEVTEAWSRGLPLPLRPFMKLVPSRELVIQRQPIDIMKEISVPLLIVHGTADEIIPFELGKRMFDAANTGKKQFCAVTGYGHNNLDITKDPAGSMITVFLHGFRGRDEGAD